MTNPEQRPERWPFEPNDINAIDMFLSLKHAWQQRRDGRTVDIDDRVEELGDRHGIYGDERRLINDLAFERVYGSALPDETAQ